MRNINCIYNKDCSCSNKKVKRSIIYLRSCSEMENKPCEFKVEFKRNKLK